MPIVLLKFFQRPFLSMCLTSERAAGGQAAVGEWVGGSIEVYQ
jgi:hypothetical protein